MGVEVGVGPGPRHRSNALLLLYGGNPKPKPKPKPKPNPNPNLNQVLATNRDRKGRRFISMVEAADPALKVYATQFHPDP